MSQQLGVRSSSHELLVQSSSDAFTSSHMYSTARLELRVLPPTTANYNIPTETGTVDQMREHASQWVFLPGWDRDSRLVNHWVSSRRRRDPGDSFATGAVAKKTMSPPTS
jgi:hypothetical protein